MTTVDSFSSTNDELSPGENDMIRCFSLLVVALVLAPTASAQFPQSLDLDARSSALVSSAPTRAGWQYTITVTGTYSMWPPYDGYGVDAAYVYDVPASEITALRWPPTFIYPIPHWVGDTLEVPPFTIPGLEFKFRTRDNIGFRVNGQPLADRGLDGGHRYQTTVVGDGQPIVLQILDSAFSLTQGRIIPRYEDNSGGLRVVIEERPLFNLCELRRECSDGRTRLAIAASVLRYDSTGRPVNTLRDPSQLAVTIDGVAVPVDSISCAHRDPVAYALVLDRSGSMDFAYEGATSRMQALRSAALGFLRSLRPGDQAELISFSFDDDLGVDVPWTSDTARLGAGIRALRPYGGTAWRDAAELGLIEAARHYNPIRAVVLLTDGDDTHSRRTLDQVVARAQTLNVPVFAIGVALVDSSERPLRYLAARSNGRFFQARDQRQMDSVFQNLSREISSDECCTLYVTLPTSMTATPGNRRLDLYAREIGGDVLLRSESLYLDDSCARVTAVDAERELGSRPRLQAWPNPARGEATAQLDVPRAGALSISLIDARGTVRTLISSHAVLPGPRRYALDLSDVDAGTYVLSVNLDGELLGSRPLTKVD